jgi:hypothetical protein
LKKKLKKANEQGRKDSEAAEKALGEKESIKEQLDGLKTKIQRKDEAIKNYKEETGYAGRMKRDRERAGEGRGGGSREGEEAGRDRESRRQAGEKGEGG